MFGFSVFLNQDITIETRNYIAKMAEIGFKGIFTSLHIPEDDAQRYHQRLSELGACAKENHLTLMADISGEALIKAGFSFDSKDIAELKQLGLTGLRMDYHISNAQIAELSRQLTVALNASTLTQADILELNAHQANMSNLEAWHNYYPRPETGLDLQWYQTKNHWLNKQGLKVQGFVTGDANLRGPLNQGLPTLEQHRYKLPFIQALDLKQTTDFIYIGDGGLSPQSQQQFQRYLKEQVIPLRIESYDQTFTYAAGIHQNRLDDARDVLRSADARFKKIPLIHPLPKKERWLGSVTIDNQDYLRYMGEIQVTKHDLPADEKVNVVGRVIEQDRPLIKYIQAGMKFSLESVEK